MPLSRGASQHPNVSGGGSVTATVPAIAARRAPRRTGRVLTAVLMPVGPAAVAIIRFLAPRDPIGPAVAAHLAAAQLTVWLDLIALLTLLPGAYAALRLTRPVAPVLTRWVGLFLVPGYLAASALFAADSLALTGTEAGLAPRTVTSLSNGYAALPPISVLFVVFVLGHIVGVVLLGILSYRHHLMPRWAAVALTVSQPMHLVAIVLGLRELDLTAWSLTALGMAFLGARWIRAGTRPTTADAAVPAAHAASLPGAGPSR
jgi:hypothetical protein